MGPRAIRVLAALSTVLVLAGGVLANRDALLEQDSSSASWVEPARDPGLTGEAAAQPAVPQPRRIVVEAGDGVRVHVEGQTGMAGITWSTRAWFAHAEVLPTPDGVVAHCQTPTPLSRCAIWVSVTTATAEDTVHILQAPGAIIGDLPPNIRTAVETVG